MTRQELSARAFEILKRDLAPIGDVRAWKAIAETDDMSLLEFVQEHETEERDGICS